MYAVEGGAGCGKTHELMSALTRTLVAHPLDDGQRVLALTFMHGAKHRLRERLHGVPRLAGRAECATVDSFAWRLARRWRGLLASLGVGGIGDEDYDAQCVAAAVLLERSEVAAWVAASFPIVLVDEAQDLRPEKLRMVAALSRSVQLLVAADEFQCLDTGLRPNPLVGWLHEVCSPVLLERPHRTSEEGLLQAAADLRAGRPPRQRGKFRILESRGDNMAPSLVSNAIGWARPQMGTIAVITPSRAGQFADRVIERVGASPSGRGNGPYTIRWELSDNLALEGLLSALSIEGTVDVATALAALADLDAGMAVRSARQWVLLQARARGQVRFTRGELEVVIARETKLWRQRCMLGRHRLSAMTVAQAKNREFDGVVVLWPYQLGGDHEHKRRLLYNAITRARTWCTVIVQNKSLMSAPPFV